MSEDATRCNHKWGAAEIAEEGELKGEAVWRCERCGEARLVGGSA